MLANQRTIAVIQAARRAMLKAKGHDHPVAESERLFMEYMDDMDPMFADTIKDEARDILDNVAKCKNPWDRRT